MSEINCPLMNSWKLRCLRARSVAGNPSFPEFVRPLAWAAPEEPAVLESDTFTSYQSRMFPRDKGCALTVSAQIERNLLKLQRLFRHQNVTSKLDRAAVELPAIESGRNY